jgi:RNA polymerase sigma-70 factor (ECF subfamily)
MATAPDTAPAAPDDDALMARYQSGDAAAFDLLYDRYRGPVWRFFLRQLPRAEAEECHQEVWLKLIGGRARYQPQGGFRAYLFTIAHHVLTDRHRRTMKHAAADPDADAADLADGGPDPEAAAAAADDAARLHHHLAALPIAQREALLLKEGAGLSLAEIAGITDTSIEGVKSRLRYAMKKLREAMTAPARTGP